MLIVLRVWMWSSSLWILDLLCVFIVTLIWDLVLWEGFVAPQPSTYNNNITADPGWHPFLSCHILSLTT